MATGAEFVSFNPKRLLGREDFADRFLGYLTTLNQDVSRAAYRKDGVFDSPLGLSADGADKFKIDGTSQAVDGDGHILDPAASGYSTGIQFQNTNTVVYDVALHYAEKPEGIQINPRSGEPEFVSFVEAIGERADPTSVAVAGNGLNVNINSVCEAGVSHAGRKCLVWKTTPGSDAILESIAIEELTVQWNGSSNYVLTAAQFGQATPSTTPAHYQVLLLGPTVRRNTSLFNIPGYCFVGKVTGAGGGNPPTTFDVTLQKPITATLSDISEILRTDTHGFTKVRVKADPFDVDEPQIEVQDSGGVPKFIVDEDGDVTIAGNLQVTGTTTQNNVVQVNSSETITDNLTAGDATTDSHLIKGTWRHTNPAASANYFYVDGTTGRVGIGQAPDATYQLGVTGGARITTGNLQVLAGVLDVNGSGWSDILGSLEVHGTFKISRGTPEFWLNEVDRTPTTGQYWRTLLSGGDMYLQENTAAGGDFSTNKSWFHFDQNGNQIEIAADLTPNGTYDVGRSGDRWAEGWFDNFDANTLTVNTTLNVAGDFVPVSASTQDIGSATKHWAEGWFDAVQVGTSVGLGSFDDILRVSKSFGALTYTSGRAIHFDFDFTNTTGTTSPFGMVLNVDLTATSGTWTGGRAAYFRVNGQGNGGTTGSLQVLNLQADVQTGHTVTNDVSAVYIQDGASAGTISGDKHAIYVSGVTGGAANYAFKAVGGRLYMSEDIVTDASGVDHATIDPHYYVQNGGAGPRALYVRAWNLYAGATTGDLTAGYFHAQSSGNVTSGGGIRALDVEVGGSGTWVSGTGIRIKNTAITCNNKYGLLVQTQSGGTSNNWGVYADGPNHYFGGNTYFTSDDHQITTGGWPFRAFHFTNTNTNRTNFLAIRGRSSFNPVLSGDTIGGFAGGGQYFAGSGNYSLGYNGGFELVGVASQNWSSTARGCNFEIRVSANSTTNATKRFEIQQDGDVFVSSGNFDVSSGRLYVNGYGSFVGTLDCDDQLTIASAANAVLRLNDTSSGADDRTIENRSGNFYFMNITRDGSTSGVDCIVDEGGTWDFGAVNGGNSQLITNNVITMNSSDLTNTAGDETRWYSTLGHCLGAGAFNVQLQCLMRRTSTVAPTTGEQYSDHTLIKHIYRRGTNDGFWFGPGKLTNYTTGAYFAIGRGTGHTTEYFRIAGNGHTRLGSAYSPSLTSETSDLTNQLNILSGVTSDGLINGIKFYEFADFGMCFGYDGSGGGTGNKLAMYYSSSATVATVQFEYDAGGNAYKPGGGSWAVLSDARLKKNVEPLAGALDKLTALRPVEFEWKSENSYRKPGRHRGFIAQEVEPLFPEWVNEYTEDDSPDKDGSDVKRYKSVSFTGFEALAVQAFRELKETINAMSQEIADLKAQLATV